MYGLHNTLRTLALVICIFAFTSAAQAGSGDIGGGGIQRTGDDLNITNQSSPPFPSDLAGGSQPHTSVSTDLGPSFIISLLINGMPLTGF